jgi:hypothetical protein
VGVFAGLAATGCGEDFAPYNRLTSFRVLALVADPPTPGPGETTKITALSYLPGVGVGEDLPGITYSWSWCPFPGSANSGYPCQVTQEQLTMLGGGAAVPPLELGTGSSAMLTHAINPAVLTQACAGVPGQPRLIECDGGFPVQVKVTATTATESITAVVTVRLRFGDIAPNQRPYIEGLAAELAKVDVPIGAEPLAVLARDKENIIKAETPETTSESYLGVGDDLQPKMVRESLTFTWFVENGTTDEDKTGFIEGVSLAKNLRNKWTPAVVKDFPASVARLVVVVQDNRGGVGWRDGFVTLSEKP